MVRSIRNEDGPGRFRNNILGHIKLFLSPTLTTKFKKEITIRFKLLNPVRAGIHDPNITLRIYGHPARSFKFSRKIRGTGTTGYSKTHQQFSIAVEFLDPVIARIRHPDIKLAMINLRRLFRKGLLDTNYF